MEKVPADTGASRGAASPRRDAIDVVVIGGGVVGCAILRSLAIRGYSCTLLEKAPDILEGASKGNSAILHTGFDSPRDSREWRHMRAGRQIYRRIYRRLGLPLLETGATVVAWTAQEEQALPDVLRNAEANGAEDMRIIGREELFEREPSLSENARAGILDGGEAVIDPWSAPLAYLGQALAHGAEFVPCAEVIALTRSGEGWQVRSKAGTFAAGIVINAAGLFADRVEALRGVDPGFRIRPRKGQFVVFDKPAASLVRSIILKVPTKRTKGILLTPTAFGNLLVGPTAEDQEDRVKAPCTKAVLDNLLAEGRHMVPDLADMSVTATFAGLRPATEHSDYILETDADANWITVAGVRSTGLTSALGLGEWAAEQCGALAGDVRPCPSDDDLDWPRVANISVAEPRDYAASPRSRIICHCEWVTEDEVRAAASGPAAAGTLGGLKRRTRVMMGRCQGFNCAGRVMALAPELFGAGDGPRAKGRGQ